MFGTIYNYFKVKHLLNKIYDNEKIEKTNPMTLKSMNLDKGTVDEMIDLLLKERRRELMFEGKRWYD